MKWIIAVLLAFCVQASCRAQGAAAQQKPQPVTPQEATALAQAIDAAAAKRKPDLGPLKAAIDREELLNRVLAGLDVPPFVRGQVPRLFARFDKELDRQLDDLIRNGGAYRLVGVNKFEGGELRPVFRLSSAEGLSYHELFLHRDKSGAVRIADLLDFFDGQRESRNLRLAAGSLLTEFGVELPKAEQDLLDAFPAVADMAKLVREHASHAALSDAFAKLPEAAKSLRTVAIYDVSIAIARGPAEYTAALKRYRKRFPNAPELDLLEVSPRVARLNFKSSLDAVGRLHKRIGDDPYLDAVTANLYLAQGNTGAAGALFRKAHEALPWARDVYAPLLQIELANRNFERAGAMLTTGEQKAGIVWGDVETQPMFAEFRKSPAYKKWKASQPASPAQSANPTR